MPREPSLKKSQRMLLVLEAVQRLSGPTEKWVKVTDIVDDICGSGYEVDKHHVQRDLRDQVLAGLHPQLELNDHGGRGVAFGYRWMSKGATPATGLTIAQAVSLILVERHLKQALPATLTAGLQNTFRKARQTLDLHNTSSGARWIEKIAVVPPTQPLLAPQIPDAILAVVQQAVIEAKQIEIVYRAAEGSPKKLTVHPLGIVQRGPATYLVATTFDYDDIVMYALHRIQSAARLHFDARKPEGFTMEQYAEQQGHFGSGKFLNLKVRVNAHLAAILDETPLDARQTIAEADAKGWRLLTAKLRDTWQLRWWILSQGDRLEVVKPIRLREEVARTLGCAGRVYDATKS